MKILVISNLYPPYYQGGYELRCREIVDGLSSMGHEVTIIASTYGVSSPRIDGRVHRVLRYMHDEITDDMYRHKLTKPWIYLAAQLRLASIGRHNARAVQKVVKSVQPDVAYVWNLSGLTISPLLPLVKEHIPRIFSLGDRWAIKELKYYGQCSLTRSLIRRLLNGVNNPHYLLDDGIFLTISEYLRDELITAGINDKKIYVLYRGTRLPEHIPPLPERSHFRMLYTGRLTGDKGVEVAIKAVTKLAEEAGTVPFTLDIAGTGKETYVQALKDNVESVGLSHQVRFLGMLPPEELARIRPQYHAFLFPSVWAEPFGGAVIEAMASGLPVLASAVGGTVEALENEVNSLTFPPGDHKALAAVIKRLMDDPGLAERLREGGRRTIKERFDFDKLLGEHEKYLLLAIEQANADTSRPSAKH